MNEDLEGSSLGSSLSRKALQYSHSFQKSRDSRSLLPPQYARSTECPYYLHYSHLLLTRKMTAVQGLL